MGKADLDRLVEDLIGTTQSIRESCEHLGLNYNSLTNDDWEYIGVKVEECSQCGYWFTPDDLDEDGYCDECLN